MDWNFLLPWLEALAPWLEFRVWPDMEKRTLRSRLRALRVYLSKPEEVQETEQETNARLLKLRETVELLGLALHYDRGTWELFERAHVKPAEYKHWTYFTDASDLEPRFELAFDVSHEDQVFEHVLWRVAEEDVFAWDMHLCDRMLSVESAQMSQEYHSARRKLVRMVGQRFDPAYRLELQFVAMPPRQPSSSYITQLHQFVVRVHDPRWLCRRVFRLTLLHAYLHSLPYSTAMAEFFEFVERSGIQLAMAGIGARTRQCAEDAMHRVVRSTAAAEEKAYPKQREDRMMIVHKADLALFQDICTQLSTGTRIDHLVLENAFANTFRDDYAGNKKWGLFGRALATSHVCVRSLKGLTLAAMMEITRDNVNLLVEGLDAAAHDATQVPVRDGVPGEQRVRLSRYPELKLPDGELLTLDSVQSALPSSGFRVVSDETSDGWTEIGVPTIGTCKVQCSDVVDSFAWSEAVVASTPTLQTLEIGCGMCKADAIVRFTKRLGRSLQYIHIHVLSDPGLTDAVPH